MGDSSRPSELDDDARKALDLAAASGASTLGHMTAEEARSVARANQAAYEAAAPHTRIDDFVVGADISQQVPIRRYRALNAGVGENLATFVYLHGGGWVTGDLNHGAWLCASLANSLGINVVSIGYRLAPEHPFPAAVEDVFSVLGWIAKQGQEIGVDTARLAVGGDSAGGCLAAVAAIYARDACIPLRAQILLYPVIDVAREHGSYERNGNGYGVTAEGMRWYRRHYLDEADAKDWRASPIYADRLEGVAPALVVSCGFDVLCDEAIAYVDRLRAAGVQVRHSHLPGQIHGFLNRSSIITEAQNTLETIGSALSEGLSK
jgi:acetyl esterase